MYKFKEYIKTYFAFLIDFGYNIVDYTEKYIQSFSLENCRIDIMFDSTRFEITCQFTNNAGNTFSLQDALSYLGIKDFKGLYQLGNKEDMEKGVIYTSKAVEKILKTIDITSNHCFQEIYQFKINSQKELLVKYYAEVDLKKAESYWNEKKYDSAKLLFEKHFNSLSKSQLKKLEYIKKNHVN